MFVSKLLTSNLSQANIVGNTIRQPDDECQLLSLYLKSFPHAPVILTAWFNKGQSTRVNPAQFTWRPQYVVTKKQQLGK